LYFRRSRGHAAASDADNPTGLTEKEKEEAEHQEEDNDDDSLNSTTATPKISTIIMSSYNYTEIVLVDDGEVMLVENTPPRPPPLPEPPPYRQVILCNIIVTNWYAYIGNNDAYNNTIIDSSLIYAIDCFKDNTKFYTSINGEKYTISQLKYKDVCIMNQIIAREEDASMNNTKN
jgi:hypothetical protein